MDQFGLETDKDEININYLKKWSNKLKFDLFISFNVVTLYKDSSASYMVGFIYFV